MNILFIGGYGNGTDANSVCIRNMANEMMTIGHKVWILAMGNDYVHTSAQQDGVTLWELPMDYYRRLTARVTSSGNRMLRLWFKLVSLFRHVALLAYYPNTSPVRSRKLAAKAKALVKENNINVVVTIFNPFDNIYAGLKVKEAFGDNVKVVSYHLDLRTASINPSERVRNYISKHAQASLVEESKTVDKVLIPYSGQKEAEQVVGINKEKLKFVGFPMYIKNTDRVALELPFEKNTVNISYIGSVSRENRDPNYVLSLLERVAEKTGERIRVHFWGDMGDMEETIKGSSIAAYHGMMENRFSRYVMEESDFLLNIGNAIAFDMLPSKVFGMFATGKPIINVIKHPKDATIPFFERYAYSIDIKEFENCANDAERLAEGMTKLKMKTPHDVDSLFDGFTPATICDIILK